MTNSAATPPTDCPSADVLHRFMEDRLPEAEAVVIEKHLEGCGDCEKSVELLERKGAGAFERHETSAQGSTSLSHGSLIELLADPVKIEALPLPEFSVPKQIDKYEILEVLGSGGMGTVLRARHLHLKREVAIKLIKGARRFDPRAVTRFLQEIEAIGKVDHANIVRAFDAGVDGNLDSGGQPYLVMELLQGRDVETLVKRRGPLSVTDSCKLIRQAATGLDQIHHAGLVHRDVKPSNLFVTDSGVVKLLDLGLARLYEDETEADNEAESSEQMDTLTSKLSILGSPHFMAPEQIERSHTVDHRADIYSFGCTFYYLLTGQPPHAGTRFEVLAAHYHRPFPSVCDHRADVSAAIDSLIYRMTQKNPAERIGSAQEVVAELDRITTVPLPSPPTLPKPERKLPLKYWLPVFVVPFLLLLLYGVYRTNLSKKSDVVETAIKPVKIVDPVDVVTPSVVSSTIELTDEQTNIPVNKLYWNTAMSGKMAFDFSKNKKCCAIGEGEYMFEIRWSTRTRTGVYVYKDPPSLDGVAVARGVSNPKEIRKASELDFWERMREVDLGNLVVLRNRHGKYAVLRVTKIVDADRTGVENDWLEFDYYILPDGDDFGKMPPLATKPSSR